jgi:predicted PurR-regulated permease PerM
LHNLEAPNSSLAQIRTGKTREFLRRATFLIALLAIAAVIWYAARVLLLAFAGILLAVFLDFLAGKVASLFHIRRGWAFALVAVTITLLLALAAWQAVPHIANQLSELVSSLPRNFERLRSYLSGREWGRTIIDYLPNLLASAHIPSEITTIVHRVVEALAGLVVIAVVGLYLAANPSFYERGFLKLLPEATRPRARDVCGELAYTLRWWILGQLVPMAVLGIATIIGLYLLNIPLAFTLGLFTAFMIFIPYIGSIIALFAAAMVALTHGTSAVMYVTLLYIGVHSAEGYLLTPLVQRRAVYLPPALTILSQLLMGLLLGFLGLALATPLTAAALVLVKMIYLHERPAHHE